MLHFVRLLGPVDVRRDDIVVSVAAPKTAALLGALALAANHPVSLVELAQTLWGDKPPASALKNLRSYAYSLRGLVGDRLVTRAGGYELLLEDDELDATVFTALADRGSEALACADILGAVAAFGEALRLWRGEVLHGVFRTERLDATLAGLRERRLAVFEDYIQARLAAGLDRELIAGVRLHLASHPFRERAWGALMLAQYRSGDVPGALASYTQMLAILREHLGVDPGPDLVELHRAVLARDPRLNHVRDARPIMAGEI
jgi:DNA-binding SARP family transcriptional activator